MGTATEEPSVPRTGLPSAQHGPRARRPSDLPGKWVLPVGRSRGKWSRGTGAAWGWGQGQARGKASWRRSCCSVVSGLRTPERPAEKPRGVCGGPSTQRRAGRGCSPHPIRQGLSVGLQRSCTQGPSRSCRRPHSMSEQLLERKGESGHQTDLRDGLHGAAAGAWQHGHAARCTRPHPHLPWGSLFSLSRLGQMNPGLPVSCLSPVAPPPPAGSVSVMTGQNLSPSRRQSPHRRE